MFRLLSRKANIFSIPIYIGVLFGIIAILSSLEFDFSNTMSTSIAFLGLALGYPLFNMIKLNRQTHLPLFLYTFFIVAFYNEALDIGISVAIFTNSILLFFFTSENDVFRKDSFILIGNLLAFSFIFLPTIWPLFLFVMIHIIVTSDHIWTNIFQLIFGAFLIFLGYFSIMYIIGFNSFDPSYIPLISMDFITDFRTLYPIIPIAILCIVSIIDHFINFNKKSPTNKFKYSFVLSFLLVQILILTFYMGQMHEYLLLTILPICIILSRFLRFLKYTWMKELGLLCIIVCCLLFKFNSFLNIL